MEFDETWDVDVDDVLNNNTSVFVVKNLTEDSLIYVMSVVYYYIIQFNTDEMKYDLLYYAEPEEEPRNQYFIFTNLPYDFFTKLNPEFLLEEKKTI
jgi:hypothetical protein